MKEEKKSYRMLADIMEESWLSDKEIADSLGISVRTVRTWLKGERVPHRYYHDKLRRILGLRSIEEFREAYILQRRAIKLAKDDELAGEVPSETWCSICSRRIPTIFEERPTGEDFAIERWGYCKRCWDDMQALRRASDDLSRLSSFLSR